MKEVLDEISWQEMEEIDKNCESDIYKNRFSVFNPQRLWLKHQIFVVNSLEHFC